MYIRIRSKSNLMKDRSSIHLPLAICSAFTSISDATPPHSSPAIYSNTPVAMGYRCQGHSLTDGLAWRLVRCTSGHWRVVHFTAVRRGMFMETWTTTKFNNHMVQYHPSIKLSVKGAAGAVISFHCVWRTWLCVEFQRPAVYKNSPADSSHDNSWWPALLHHH